MRTNLQTSSGVTLAPKPGSIVVTTAQPSAVTRLIVPISKPQLTPTKGQSASLHVKIKGVLIRYTECVEKHLYYMSINLLNFVCSERDWEFSITDNSH